MRKFNEEDYNLVKGYERDFTRAIESRYCTGLLKEELEVIKRIYRETLNRNADLSCGGCVLQMMTSVGRLYRSYKENKVKEESKNVQEIKTEIQDSKGRAGKESDNQLTGGNVGSEGNRRKGRRSKRAGGSQGDDRKEQDKASGVAETGTVSEAGQQE